MHNQPREPRHYEDCQVNRFKNLGELHKEWTEAGVKASRAFFFKGQIVSLDKTLIRCLVLFIAL